MNTRAITQNKKVVTFGEVMLRLTAPNFQRFSQTNEFIATYGGSEANVAISLVNFGIPTEFVTRLPENAMAQACVNSLQAYGLGMYIAFVFNDTVITAPQVNSPIESGCFQISNPHGYDLERIFRELQKEIDISRFGN